MYKTAQDAIDGLKDGSIVVNSKDDFVKLLKELSGAVQGATKDTTYLLYSGPLEDGSWARDAVSNIRDVKLGVSLSDSEAGKFLRSEEYLETLKKVALIENIEPGTDPNSLTREQREKLNQWTREFVYGEEFGTRIRVNNTSVFDIVSESFVRDAIGDFRIIAGTEINPKSIFVESELPALLKNEIARIGGIPAIEFARLGANEANDVLVTFSKLHSRLTGITPLNFEEFVKLDFRTFQSMLDDRSKYARLADLTDGLTRAELDDLARARSVISDKIRLNGQSGLASLGGMVSVLGTALVVGSVALLVKESYSARQAGDSERAAKILADGLVGVAADVALGNLVIEGALAAARLRGLAMLAFATSPVGLVALAGLAIVTGVLTQKVVSGLLKGDGADPVVSENEHYRIISFANGVTAYQAKENAAVEYDLIVRIQDEAKIQLNEKNTASGKSIESTYLPGTGGSDPILLTRTVHEVIDGKVSNSSFSFDQADGSITESLVISTINGEFIQSSKTITLASGTSVTEGRDAVGNWQRDTYDADKVRIRQDWHKADGSQGFTIWSSDSKAIDSYRRDADGTATSFKDDGAGYQREQIQNAHGELIKETWKSTLGSGKTEVDAVTGTRTTVEFRADGSLRASTLVKANGDTTIASYDGAGKPITLVTRSTDGTVVQQDFNGDGSSRIHMEDRKGNIRDQVVGTNKQLVSETWRSEKGESGSTQFNVDGEGTNTGTIQLTTGDRVTFSENGGERKQTLIDGGGVVRQIVTTSERTGTTVVESFQAGVTTRVTTNKLEGSREEYIDDGQGNWSKKLTIDGKLQSESRHNADGSSSQSQRQLDGSMVGINIRPDGSYDRTSSDSDVSMTTSYDAQGNFVKSERKSSVTGEKLSKFIDPNTGIVVVVRESAYLGEITSTYDPNNGTIRTEHKRADGTRMNTVDNQSGERIVTEYGKNGVGIVSNTVIQYNADGSGKVIVTDAQGRTTETNYPAGSLGPSARVDAPRDTLDKTELPLIYTPMEVKLPEWAPLLVATRENLEHLDPVRVELIEKMKIERDRAEQIFVDVKSPLILDLDGDGVETLSIKEGVHFDHDGNGTYESTGWVGRDDGLLVLDVDDNGRIEGGGELFGNNTRLPNGQKAANGFEALRQWDWNHDGQIDTADFDPQLIGKAWDINNNGWYEEHEYYRPIYDRLRVWRDQNANGVVDTGELSTLSDLGIAWISTLYEDSKKVDAKKNQARQLGQFGMTDDQVRQVHDVWFEVGDSAATPNGESVIDLPEAIKSLPNIAAFGALRSLHLAMNGDPALLQLVKQYLASSTEAEKADLASEIGLRWTGADTYVPPYDSPFYDEKKLLALDVASGRAQYNRSYNDRPFAGPQASPHVEAGFAIFVELIRRGLDSTTNPLNLATAFTVIRRSDGAYGLSWDGYTALKATDPKAALYALLNFVQNGSELYGLVRDAAQLLKADYAFYAADPALAAYAQSLGFAPGASGPMAGLYSGLMVSTTGSDTIMATPGKDVMDGLAGDDTIIGPGKGDQVIWGRGAGQDVIVNPGGGYIAIGAGIAPEDVKVERVGTSVVLSLETGERLEIQGWQEGGIDAITFADGYTWDRQALREMTVYATEAADEIRTWTGTRVLDGGSGSDSIYSGGSSGAAQVLRGGDGYDVIQANGMHDVVIGGRGNDTLFGDVLIGGEGDDVIYGLNDASGGTLYYNLGDGVDRLSFPNLTVVLGEGITRETLRFEYDVPRGLLRVRFDGHEGGLDVPSGQVRELRLSDGTSIKQVDVEAIIRTLRMTPTEGTDYLDGLDSTNDRLVGLGGDDYLSGNAGDDTLIGGSGNDQLTGGEGNDTYVLDNESGQDIIYDGTYHDREPRRPDVETIEFAGTQEELTLSQSGGFPNSLIIGKVRTSSTIRVESWFEQERFDSLRIRFSDGSVLEGDALVRATTQGNSLAMHGGSGADSIVGTAAGERIRGAQGNDTLDGGAGNDVLMGGTGADVYLFGRGDGHDSVVEYASQGLDRNVIRFKEGISRGDLAITRGFLGIYEIRINGTDDVLKVDAQDGALKVLEFADGTVSSLTANPNGTMFADAQNQLEDTESDDVVVGDPSGSRITSRAGDDLIQLRGGSNLVSAYGQGRDTIVGGGFNTISVDSGDTVGFGPDNPVVRITGTPGTIRLSGGLSFDQLTPSAVLDSWSGVWVLTYTAPGNQLLVFNDVLMPIGRNGWSPNFVNSDGTLVDSADVRAKLPENLKLILAQRFGTAGPDSIAGGDGNDLLNGGAGPDTLMGGKGNDTISGDGGSDRLVGGDGDDQLYDSNNDGKEPGDNVFEGGAGDDRIQAWTDGYDRFLFNEGFGRDTLNLRGTGRKEIVFGAGVTPDNIVVTGDGFDNTMKSLYLSRLGTGDRVQIGGWFDDAIGDRLSVRFADGTVWDRTELLRRFYMLERGGTMPGSLGADLLIGDSTRDTLIGRDGNDTLRGAQGDDDLLAGLGDDELQGGTGDDRLLGGEGSDIYLIAAGQGHDTLVELSGHGQGELDVLRLVGDIRPQDVRVHWAGDDMILLLPGDGQVLLVGEGERRFGLERVEFESGASWSLQDLIDRANTPSTMAKNGVITGTTQDDVLQGGAGSDRLLGGTGEDTLDGGAGADTLEGGAGDDVYRVDNAADRVFERFGGGVDTVEASVNWTLGDDVEQLRLLNGGLSGTGNALDNHLFGSSGDDTLSGGGGRDTLEGGEGNDTYIVEGGFNETVTIVELADSVDTVLANGNYVLDDGLEVLRLMGQATAGTGNIGANTLIANVLDSSLDGEGGDDLLLGGIGNDALIGDWGRDTLIGGEGRDTLAGGVGDDLYIIDGADEEPSEVMSGGVDTVQSPVSYTLQANFENLVLTGTALNAIGNSEYNLLQGNARNNRLDGLGGADTMRGGTGDDVYVVNHTGDQAEELPDEGYDAVESSVTYTLAANVEKLTLTGNSGIGGTGSAQDNLLIGNGGANRLDGGAGNDRIDGGTGNDTMTGGIGDDVFVVGSTGDVVTEAANGGFDTVESSVTYTLSNEVERLVLTGSSAINGTGNVLANALTGNAGINRLDGGAGADTMSGGAGNDTYVVDNVLDVTLEEAGGGTDAVESSVTWTLSTETENLTLTGTASVGGTGNAVNNTIRGNTGANALSGAAGSDSLVGGAGDDTLDGGIGTDTLVGGAGNDTFVVDVTTDVITEVAGEGTDTVVTAVTLTLGSTLENVTLSGNSGIGATGNASANVMTGNAGANALSGAAGNDTLDGGGGNDTLTGGAGADGYGFGRGYRSDTIVENDATTGVKDFVSFGANIAKGDITFQRSGNALLAKVNGTSDVLTLQDWYLGTKYHVEEFRFGDGTVLTDTQAQSLVSAMAAFTASGTTSSVASTSDTSQRMPSMAVNEPTRHMSF